MYSRSGVIVLRSWGCRHLTVWAVRLPSPRVTPINRDRTMNAQQRGCTSGKGLYNTYRDDHRTRHDLTSKLRKKLHRQRAFDLIRKRQLTTQAAHKRETGHSPVKRKPSKKTQHRQAPHCFVVFLACWRLGEVTRSRFQRIFSVALYLNLIA